MPCSKKHQFTFVEAPTLQGGDGSGLPPCRSANIVTGFDNRHIYSPARLL